MYTHAAVARRCLWAGFRPQLWLLVCLLGATALACGSNGSDDTPDGGTPPPDGGGGDAGPDSKELTCQGLSGKRIRQVIRQNGDGTSQFIRLHDTEYDETCAFATASDDQLRCLPVADGAPFADGSVLYQDKACLQRIGQLIARAGDPAPRYMRQLRPTAACQPAVADFYTLGAKVEIAAGATIFSGGPAACAPGTAAEADFFAISGDLAPTAFAAGTRTDTASGRISLGQVDGEDGSRFCDVEGALRDAEFGGISCALQLGEDGTLRCLPQQASELASASVNADCSLPADFAVLGECNASAVYLTDQAPSPCQLRRRVRQIGAAATVYTVVAEVCTQFVPPPTHHQVGASISSFSFAEFLTESVPTGGRLERLDLYTIDGLRLSQSAWLDTTYGEPCTFRLAEDGDLRCLPIDSPLELVARPSAARYYTDADCTQTVAAAERDASCEAGAPKFVLEQTQDGRTRVYEAEAAGTLYQVAEGCVLVPDGTSVYRIGAPIPALRFVGGAEMVE